MPERHFLRRGLLLVRRTAAKSRWGANTEWALWLIALQAGTARLKKKGQWSTVQSQVNGSSESRRSVGIERPHDLVVGLERSYKRLGRSLGKPRKTHESETKRKLAQSDV